ncbi:MAG: putative zinc-binding protein [Deltaproteobacteria bacterium]|nr:putative zinc-binding protein [Deltaproteobacteria bacterium]MBW1736852.1 putative zinc-binding protein [Deltaproteobacteria bacterium]MBW1910341.1 putative zinc-binding protein [Deltaproteobacteria bacterium]MBW2032991.1 putative zinc-binding protein [Deltaproteobacteria bacterium]MBW2114741.1 putative zinc-binding protein [Deltaproteobacteria bacterium]
MSQDCCTSNENVMILACSGGSNVGQLSNRAAVELTQEGFGKMYCLAGIGGHLSGFVQSTKDVPQMVAIDGCSVGCARAILDHAEVPIKNYLVVTDVGIEKKHELNLEEEDVQKVKEAIKEVCNKEQPVIPIAETGRSICCG